MSVITFPSTLTVRSQRWEQMRNDETFRSTFGAQSLEVSAPLWATSIIGKQVNDSDAGEFQSLIMKLKGKTNQLELWNLMRPIPLGTMRGTMTFNANAAAGDTALSIIAATEAAKTLLKGDLLGFGSGVTQQVVMVVADAVANGSGIIAVTVEPSIRNAFVIGNGVTWNQPKVLFRNSGANAKNGWDYSEMLVSGFNLDLIEDWRP